MKLKQNIKKYRFLASTYLTDKYKSSKHYLLGFIDNTHPRKYSPLETERLPYPVRWENHYKYKQLKVEIGTGHGELLAFLAKSSPQDLAIGFEITKTYSIKTDKKIKDQNNALQYKGDGYFLVNKLFSNNSINEIYILFPDPWHKKRHNKRRPFTTDWLREVSQKLVKEGEIFFATDWLDYYQFALSEVGKLPEIYSIQFGEYEPTNSGLVETHYYKKWKKLGREFNYIRAKKISN